MNCTLGEPDVQLWMLIPEVLVINWDKDGDEWIKHLHTEFRETLGTQGASAAGPHSTQHFAPLHLEYKLNTQSVKSTLVLIFDQRGLRVALAGVDEPSRAETENWLSAIDGAFGRLGRASVDHRWQAIIGPAPGSLDPGGRWQETLNVGGLTVRPGDVRFERVDCWSTYTAILESGRDQRHVAGDRGGSLGRLRVGGRFEVRQPFCPSTVRDLVPCPRFDVGPSRVTPAPHGRLRAEGPREPLVATRRRHRVG